MSETQYGIPYPGPMPSPTPEHQRRIIKEKAFEIVTVVVLIIGFFGFLAWRNYVNSIPPPASTLQEAAAAVQAAGAVPGADSALFQREFRAFSQPVDYFTRHIRLIGERADAPLETLLVWLTPAPGQPAPPIDKLQNVVNDIRELAVAVLPTASVALETAVATSEYIKDTPRPLEKGVASTSDGWKLTYVTYRSFDENADPPQPVLVLVLQRLSAGENPALGDMNRILFEAVQEGQDIMAALQAGSVKN